MDMTRREFFIGGASAFGARGKPLTATFKA